MAKIDELESGLVDCYGEQVRAEIGPDGKEYGDPIPKAPPVGMSRAPTLAETIRSMVRREMSDMAHNSGFESFEEAEDFDIADDPQDPHTPYEAVFDPPPPQPVKETEDGVERRNEGGVEAPRGGSGKSGKVGKDQSKPKPAAADPGGVPAAASGDPGTEDEN